ncbi:DUF7503 family protein [Salinadaptatus halalkaliphilus]|nr:hypothetical protein [Salinadaptatus halalkaliphilus]
MSAKDSMEDYLAQNPRMIGALFTLLLLLSQAGTVVAGSSTQVGP